jgi:hypothetical protein
MSSSQKTDKVAVPKKPIKIDPIKVIKSNPER